MANVKKSIDEIISATGQTLKPYDVYRILAEAVSSVDPSREMKPQMMYNYDRNGLIVKGRKAIETGSAGRYTVQEALEFVSKWVMRNYKVQWPAAQQQNTIESDEVEGQLDMFEIEA